MNAAFKYRVAFFTDYSARIGLGHVSRCRTIAASLTQNGASVEMIAAPEPGGRAAKTNGIRIAAWRNLDEFRRLCEEIGADFCFIDSYFSEHCIYEEALKRSRATICIDDFARIEYPPGCFVLNPGAGVRPDLYAHPADRILAGPEFAIVRAPFSDTRAKRLVRNQVQAVLITTGGSDGLSLSPKIVDIVRRIYPNVEVTVIVGPFFSEEVRSSLEKRDCHLLVAPSAEAICSAMEKCDFCVTAGGQTVYELAALQTPMGLLMTADNQRPNIEGFLEKEAAVFCGSATGAGIDGVDPAAIESLGVRSLRCELSENCGKLVDGRGVDRIRAALLAFAERSSLASYE